MKIVVFSGAGVSADSGISTFRDSDGLWANYRIEDVCTPNALLKNREKVINFYNIRRKELLEKSPNEGHRAIVELSKYFNVEVVTQNIDDLHERAAKQMGAPLKVTHMHGELLKLRSSIDENGIVPINGWEQKIDSCHDDGSLLRPFVVFFTESVPMFDKAVDIVKTADILIIIGTSLAVYPAASLVGYVKEDVPIYIVDPSKPEIYGIKNKIIHIKERASIGMPQLLNLLTNKSE